jgi:predicted nucleic acid-binding protein
MKPAVYIETSIPSFYYETRTEAEFVAMRNWTCEWWDERKVQYDCFVSSAVIDELESGDYPMKTEKVQLISAIEYLEINSDIEEIVEVYLANCLMPKDVLGDALHLAIASYHKMDYLLTWNCSHLANSNKRRHIRLINGRLRISTPEILTPMELDDRNEGT